MHIHLNGHQIIPASGEASALCSECNVSRVTYAQKTCEMLAVSPLNLLSIKAHLTLFSMIRIGFHL